MKYIKHSIAILFLLCLFVSILHTEGQQENNKKLSFIMVPKGVHPYYEPCFSGFKDAAKKYGVNAEMISPPRFDLDLQIKIIQDLAAQAVDGIAISAYDDKGLIPVIENAFAAGVKVITFDAPAPSTKALAYVGTDNYKAGYEAGKKVAALIDGQGEVALLQGGLETLNLNLRMEGFKQALLDFTPQVKVVAVADIKGDFAVAISKTETLLDEYPNLRAFFGVSAYGACAAGMVVNELGRRDIVVAGFDDLPDTLKGIREGYIQFCIVQQTYKMGWLSVELLLDAINGESIPRNIDTGIVIVDKDNIDSYAQEMKNGF